MQGELEAAVRAAKSAGRMLRKHFSGRVEVALKGAIDPVTQYDVQAENLITSILGDAFPAYGMLGEEQRNDLREDAPNWIVDPLDGTTNYARGYPMYAVSIALQIENRIELGVVYNPLMDELFVAQAGRGATLNSKPIRVSNTHELGRAVLASGFPYDVWTTPRDNLKEWAALTKRIFSPRCDGCASLDLCYVAAGRFDGYWELDLEAWDMAAGAIIAMEAGATVTCVDGAAFDPFGRSVLAANPSIYALLRQSLH